MKYTIKGGVVKGKGNLEKEEKKENDLEGGIGNLKVYLPSHQQVVFEIKNKSLLMIINWLSVKPKKKIPSLLITNLILKISLKNISPSLFL